MTNEMRAAREGFSPPMDPWPHVASVWLQTAEISLRVFLSLQAECQYTAWICLSVYCEWLGEKGDKTFVLSFQVS
jgi:hypothetical protein